MVLITNWRMLMFHFICQLQGFKDSNCTKMLSSKTVPEAYRLLSLCWWLGWYRFHRHMSVWHGTFRQLDTATWDKIMIAFWQRLSFRPWCSVHVPCLLTHCDRMAHCHYTSGFHSQGCIFDRVYFSSEVISQGYIFKWKPLKIGVLGPNYRLLSVNFS